MVFHGKYTNSIKSIQCVEAFLYFPLYFTFLFIFFFFCIFLLYIPLKVEGLFNFWFFFLQPTTLLLSHYFYYDVLLYCENWIKKYKLMVLQWTSHTSISGSEKTNQLAIKACHIIHIPNSTAGYKSISSKYRIKINQSHSKSSNCQN